MNDDNIQHWVDRAKILEEMPQPVNGVRVIRNNAPAKSKGQMIMEIANLLLPDFQKLLSGKRDRDGLVLQPAHIRGIALNYAEYYVKAKTENNQAA